MFRLPKEPKPFSLPLTKERLNWQLDVLGWSRNELARRTDVSMSKAAQWVSGKSFVPNRLAVWLEMLALAMVGLGRPLLWDRDPRIGDEQHRARAQAAENAWTDPRARRDEAA